MTSDELCDEHHYPGEPGVCPGCAEYVDAHGNTESQFKWCAFPDCGCDGARLCMAPMGASDTALRMNVEGMWSGKSAQQRKAVLDLAAYCAKGSEEC